MTEPTPTLSPKTLYVSVRTVSEMLSINPGTLRRWITEGKMPAIRVGGGMGVLRVPRSWLEEQMKRTVVGEAGMGKRDLDGWCLTTGEHVHEEACYKSQGD